MKSTNSPYKQLPGEHIQSFAWRIENALMENYGLTEVEEPVLVTRVLSGLYPSIKSLLPDPIPTTLHKLFCFAEIIDELLPPEDSFWRSAESTRFDPPECKIQIDNDLYIAPASVECYKCGLFGHMAKFCKNPRNNKLKPKCKKRQKKRCKRLTKL